MSPMHRGKGVPLEPFSMVFGAKCLIRYSCGLGSNGKTDKKAPFMQRMRQKQQTLHSFRVKGLSWDVGGQSAM